jgi:hypothetical protein
MGLDVTQINDPNSSNKNKNSPFFISPKIVKMTGSPGWLWHL